MSGRRVLRGRDRYRPNIRAGVGHPRSSSCSRRYRKSGRPELRSPVFQAPVFQAIARKLLADFTVFKNVDFPIDVVFCLADSREHHLIGFRAVGQQAQLIT